MGLMIMENKNNPIIPVDVEVLDNPLMAGHQKELSISPAQENEQKIEIINDIESNVTLIKQQLQVKRQKVEIQVENKKLDTANKAIDSIEKIINAVSKEEVLERVTKNIKTPMDMKMMAEAAERLTNSLKGLMNSNVLDDMGNKKKQKINFMFKTSGGEVQGAIQVDNSQND